MIEHLYFKSYYAYLLGNLDECKMYYEFMKEEYRLRPDKNALNKYQLENLRDIKTAVETGKITVSGNLQDTYSNAIIPTTVAPQRQYEIVQRIHKEAFSQLGTLINAGEGFHLANVEHPCPPYGAVDMSYSDNITAFPLEVKKDRGDHDLIGQIAKYTLHFKLQLHYKLYQKVQPITICGSYDDFTLRELKKMGVLALGYKLEGMLKLFAF